MDSGSDPYDLTEWKKFISSSITNDSGQVPRTVKFGRTVLKDRFHPTAQELEILYNQKKTEKGQSRPQKKINRPDTQDITDCDEYL